MNQLDRAKETSTSIGTGNMTLGGAVAGFVSLVSGFSVAQTGIVLCIQDALNNWEISRCTLVSSTVISRDTVLSSSNANALVNFPSGSKTIFNTMSAADFAAMITTSATVTTAVAATSTSKLLMIEAGTAKSITVDNFVAAIGQSVGALTAAGALAGSNIIVVSQDGGTTEVRTTLTALAAYVASTLNAATAISMTGPTAGTVSVASTNFTIGANGNITGTIVVTPSDAANGGTFTPATVSISSASPTATFTYTPASAGAKTISATNNGSLTNPANITYTSSAAAATAITLTGPTSGTVSAASTAFTAGANGVITGTIIVTPSDAANGGAFTPTSVSISSATPTATFTYTPASTGAKTVSVTNNASLTNPANITYTSNAAATVSGAPTIGTAVAGNASATVPYTAPASNGGSTIISYTATSSPGGITGTLTQAGSGTITVTGLTNGTAYTFTVTALNGVGTSAASAASNSVTPAVSVPAYLFAPTAYAFPASGANITTNGYAGTSSCDIYIKTAGGVTPANVKMCFDKSSTVAPTTYAHVGNIANPNDIKTCTRTGGWTQGGSTGQSFYGLYGLGGASLYAYGTAGDYYLWILTDDGFSKCYDNNTGTAVKWTLV